MKITLQAVEMESTNEISEEDKTFSVTYFASEPGEFLIPRTIYQKAVSLVQSLVKETPITVMHNGEQKSGFLSEITPKEEGPFPDSHWGSLRVIEHSDEGGYSLRKPRGRDTAEKNFLYISPWEIIDKKKQDTLYHEEQETEVTKPLIERILNDIEVLYKNNTDRYEVFMYEVDKKTFFDYLSVVALEMNIQEIQRRLENMFYRHIEAIISDIEMISYNCSKYNDPSSIIADFAKELVERMTLIVQGKVDHEAWKPTEPLASQLTNTKREEPVESRRKIKIEQPIEEEEESISTPPKPVMTHSVSIKTEKEDEDPEKGGMTLRPKRPVRYKHEVIEYDKYGRHEKEETRESGLRSSARLGLRSSARRTNEIDNIEIKGRDTELVLTRHSGRLRSKRTMGDDEREKDEDRERDRGIKLEERVYEPGMGSAKREEEEQEDQEEEKEIENENKEEAKEEVIGEKKEEEMPPVVIYLVRREVGRSTRSERSNLQYFVVDSFEEKKPVKETKAKNKKEKPVVLKEEENPSKEEGVPKQDVNNLEAIPMKEEISAGAALEQETVPLPLPMKQENMVEEHITAEQVPPKEEAPETDMLLSNEVLPPIVEEHKEEPTLALIPKGEEKPDLKEEEKEQHTNGELKTNGLIEEKTPEEEEGGKYRRTLRKSARNQTNFYNESKEKSADEESLNGIGEDKEGDYKRRLRNPGRHLAHLYNETKERPLDEEGLNGRTERPKRRPQLQKQKDKLQIKLQLQDNMIYQEGAAHENHVEEETSNTQEEEKAINGLEHPKPVLDDFEEESSTKVRLVLPKADEKVLPESQMTAKRYNTRSVRR